MTSLPLALAGFAFPNYDPPSLLSFASSLDARGIDYWPWNKGEWTSAEFAARAEDAGITILCVNLPSSVARVADPAANRDFYSEFLRSADDAAILGAEAIQVYAAVPEAHSAESSAQMLAEALQPVLIEAGNRGLKIRLENNLDQRGEDPRGLNPSRSVKSLELAFDLVKSDNFDLCFDPANFVAVGVDPGGSTFTALRNHFGNVHLKDCRRYVAAADSGLVASELLFVDALEGAFLPTVVGEGAVPWREIAAGLRTSGYDGWVTLDPFIAPPLLESWCAASARNWTTIWGDTVDERD